MAVGLPTRLRPRLVYHAALSAADPRTFVRYWRLERHHAAGDAGVGPPVPLRLRQLGGVTVWARPGTSDIEVVRETFFGRFHLPPEELGDRPLRTILDLGSNIGLTVAHFAALFPEARILGVELDSENAVVARRNVQPWDPRVTIRHGAAWTANGTVAYARPAGIEYGFRIGRGVTGAEPDTTAPAFAIGSLVNELAGPNGPLDYVKMDVEGAERELLGTAGWSERVTAINVEVHPPYGVEACQADLRRLGFRARVDTRHWACVLGVRDS